MNCSVILIFMEYFTNIVYIMNVFKSSAMAKKDSEGRVGAIQSSVLSSRFNRIERASLSGLLLVAMCVL